MSNTCLLAAQNFYKTLETSGCQPVIHGPKLPKSNYQQFIVVLRETTFSGISLLFLSHFKSKINNK